MFSGGLLLWMLADRVQVRRWLFAASLGVILVAQLTPNYRLMAAPAVAYACIVGALVLGGRQWSALRHDVSYGVYIYSFPVQQAVLLVVGPGLGWPAFAGLSVVLVLPVAAASWWLVERPCLGIRRARALQGRTLVGQGVGGGGARQPVSAPPG
jgi:peptidoglycan/LPS O-acetylase OafA/YrhL